jgi:hypothetical protein
MNPKELRIGNIIRATATEKDGILTSRVTAIIASGLRKNSIKEIHHETIDGQWLGITNIEIVSPIPLTAEWLERFGFEIDENGYTKEEVHVKCRDDKSVIYWDSEINRFPLCHTGHKYEYVHQLQNLYFAMTGEELELEEPIGKCECDVPIVRGCEPNEYCANCDKMI